MIKYNLYFKNVPLDSTEEELKEFFSLFGEIKSLKLMRKKVEVAAPVAEEEEKSSEAPPQSA
jgi:RNA recognition motif-containing protein